MKLDKKNQKILLIVGSVLVILFLLSQSKNMSVTDIGNASSGGTSTSGGGGGGGGGGGDGGGVTPPDGFVCETCDAQFLVGNPTFVTDNYVRPGLEDYLPFLPKKQGHWNCIGPCTYQGVDVSATFNCVIDPTAEIPEGGYDSIVGEQPDCVCLKRNPGECNWYDANFGEGIDNLQCGGSCPPGERCVSGTANGKDQCRCTKDDAVVECGFHFVDGNGDSYELSSTALSGLSEQDFIDACSGWCEDTQSMENCVYWRNSTDYGNTWTPACSCRQGQEEFGCTDTDGGINYPLAGVCTDTQNWADVCDTAQTTYLWEMRCDEIGVCGSVHHNCADDGMVCANGQCVIGSPQPIGIKTSTFYTR